MKRKLLQINLLALGLLALSQGNAQTTFNYTGTAQTYTVPVGVTSLTLDVYGAQGGFGYAVPAVGAGLGGRVQASLAVTPGEVLNIYVGGQGGAGGTTIGGTAGYNGGGTGGGWAGGRSGGGGGGASDIRQGGSALTNRVVIAAGGGGTGVNYSTGNRGGDGGGLVGANGLTGTYLGAGATQSAGGAPNGALGLGGNAPAGQTGGGGGGGYYGGGASAWEGGGGGSSYTTPVVVTAVTHTAGARTGNGLIIITPVIVYNASIALTTAIQCFGQTNGVLTATPIGGTAPFTYSWAPAGGTGASTTGIGAGTYTVTVTDATSLVTTQTFTITQPTALTATSTSTSVACFGGSGGFAAVSASGSTAPYTYQWSNGGITSTISGLAAGVYSCTVTCSSGCTTTASTTVTQPSAITVSPMQTNISCNGGSNGSAMAMVSGGTPGYTYSWSPSGGNASSASSLSAGSYTCTVTDANACTSTQTFNITAPSAVAASAVAQPVLCNGGGTTVNVSGSGGVSPYSGTGTFTAAAGTFTYTVTDANGCFSTTSVTITEPAAIVTSVSQTNVTCNGGADGSIDLTVNGGTAPFTFDWNSGTYTTEDLTGLSAGTYAGVLTDANGCTDSGTITITEPNAIVATLAIANDTTCSADGAFALTGATPAGGVFSGPGVSGGSFDPSVAGAGVHVITYIYTDSSGCTASATDSIYVDVCTGTQVYGSTALVAIYPNPNNGTFNIQVASVSDVNIYDAQGKLVYAQKVQPNVQHTLNLTENGVYMINVTNANGERTSQRVMVTK